MTHILRIDEMNNDGFNGLKQSRQNHGLNRKKYLTDGCIVSIGDSMQTIQGFAVYVDYKKHQEWFGEKFQMFNHKSQDIIFYSNVSKGGFINVGEGGIYNILYEYNYTPIEDYDDELYFKNTKSCIPYIYDKTIDIEQTSIDKLDYEPLKNLISGVKIISSMFEK